MKIKSNNNSKVNFKNELNFLKSIKKKNIIFFFFIVLLISFISISLLYLGASLQKKQYAASIKQIIYDASKTKLSFLKNFYYGLLSNPEVLKLDIEFEELQKLNFARDSALSRGFINDEDQSIEVKAKINYKNKNYKIKISPTGLNLDMIGSTTKRAYKVKVQNSEKIFGMPEFKILPPNSRHNMVEWIGHEIEKQEDLIQLKYFFIKLFINGEDLGIFAIEEHFNKEMLERQGVREGVIFKFDEKGEIKPFNKNKIDKDQNKKGQLIILNESLQGLKDNIIDIERIFDLKKFAKYLAIMELMNSYHAILDLNSFYYFNPITKLIEPIIREYNSLRYSEGAPESSNFVIKYIKENSNLIYLNKLIANKNFINIYLQELFKISQKKYLDDFFININDDYKNQIRILYKDNPFYKFPKEYLYLRQEQIKDFINSNFEITANVNQDENFFNYIEFENNSLFPIEITKIYSKDNNMNIEMNELIMPNTKFKFNISHFKKFDNKDFYFKYKVFGIENITRDKLILSKSFKTGIILNKLWNDTSLEELKSIGIKVDNQKNLITFTKSEIHIKNDIYLPAGYKIIGTSGLKINLTDDASIFSKSPFLFNGNRKNPILITSNLSNGGGIIIYNAKKNIFEFTKFSNLDSPHRYTSGITASISFYESEVYFENCSFEKNKSEDFLNFIRSNFRMNNVNFLDVYSDAIDSDFSTGQLFNIKLNNIGNDAIDFSGSDSELKNINVIKVGDKAISAGEKSKISINNIFIKDAQIAVTSKDKSSLNINNLSIENTALGIAVYQKKKEYGGAFLDIYNLNLKNVSKDFLVESDSFLSIDNIKIEDVVKNVSDQLYGNLYGKSSK